MYYSPGVCTEQPPSHSSNPGTGTTAVCSSWAHGLPAGNESALVWWSAAFLEFWTMSCVSQIHTDAQIRWLRIKKTHCWSFLGCGHTERAWNQQYDKTFGGRGAGGGFCILRALLRMSTNLRPAFIGWKARIHTHTACAELCKLGLFLSDISFSSWKAFLMFSLPP